MTSIYDNAPCHQGRIGSLPMSQWKGELDKIKDRPFYSVVRDHLIFMYKQKKNGNEN